MTAPPPRRVEPGLYLVATPIGNLRDITLRALDVLAAADLVLAEDTRVTAKLLSAYGLKARLERCDDHASARAADLAVERLREGQVVALVSDAGTPLVSDPGFVVARAVIAEGLPVHPIPGASSLLAALESDCGVKLDVSDFQEHAIGAGGDAMAAAYVQCRTGDGRTIFGVGMDADVATASVRAVLSAANGV